MKPDCMLILSSKTIAAHQVACLVHRHGHAAVIVETDFQAYKAMEASHIRYLVTDIDDASLNGMAVGRWWLSLRKDALLGSLSGLGGALRAGREVRSKCSDFEAHSRAYVTRKPGILSRCRSPRSRFHPSPADCRYALCRGGNTPVMRNARAAGTCGFFFLNQVGVAIDPGRGMARTLLNEAPGARVLSRDTRRQRQEAAFFSSLPATFPVPLPAR